MTRRAYSSSARKWIEVIETPNPGVQAERTKRSGFTMFPQTWRLQLRKVKARGTTYEVAMVILDLARWSEWVTLPNVGLAKQGISRYAKYDALKQLRDAGLIIVKSRGRKSPRIKALFLACSVA
jgi:hypothetical protein